MSYEHNLNHHLHFHLHLCSFMAPLITDGTVKTLTDRRKNTNLCSRSRFGEASVTTEQNRAGDLEKQKLL